MRLDRLLLAAVSALFFAGAASVTQARTLTLLNVSYDPTRELYEDYNAWFSRYWEDTTGNPLTVRQSHGGSASQARSVIDGVPADIVSLAVASDIQGIVERSGLIAADWPSQFPHDSAPYTTVQVFVVREGNPKHIRNWNDLTRSDVSVITPNPKTSGAARWNFLAAWGWARAEYGSDAAARQYITRLYRNVPVLDSGARGATTTFVKRRIGDVLITYENEALLVLEQFGKSRYDIVVPEKTVLVQPPVAIVNANATAHGTAKVARAYIENLYSDKGQRLIGKHYYRPVNARIRAEFSDRYAEVETFTVASEFGGWAKAQARFFDEGGVFDQIYLQGRH